MPIYDDRPSPCRLYTCEHDERIWTDFEAMELNQEWIDANLAQERGPVELFMEQTGDRSSARRPGD